MEENKNESIQEEVAEKTEVVEEKPVEQEKEEVLSDDELYAKIETEKLLKRKKKKKIATFVSLMFAMVLAVCVIILAAVPISLKPKCLESGFKDVGLYAGKSAPVVYADGEEGYDKFMKKYSQAFSQTYLTALFNGSLSSFSIDEGYTKVDDKNQLSTIKSLAGTNRFVRFRYSENKTFTNQNGKKYSSKYSNSRWDGTLTFSEAYLIVNSEDGVQTATIYVVADYPVFSGGEETSTQKCLVTVTVKADTNVIYDAWNDLV